MSQSPKTKAQGSRTKDVTARYEEPPLSQSLQASSSLQAPQEIPDPQVIAGNTEFGNRYPRTYKIKILQESDACTKPGELGQFLRQAGLTHATLTGFRKQRAAGTLNITGTLEVTDAPQSADTPQSPRTNKKIAKTNQDQATPDMDQAAQSRDQAARVMDLERQNRQLQRKLQQAEAILEIQKKVSYLLEISLDKPEN